MTSHYSGPKHRAAGKPITMFDDLGSLTKRTAGIALTSGAAFVAIAPVAGADEVAGTVTTGKGSSELSNLRSLALNEQQVATFTTSANAKWNIDEVEFEVKELPPPPPPPPPPVTQSIRSTVNSSSRSYERAAVTAAPNPVGGSITDIAAANLGIPYSSKWDCSGFVQYVYAQAGKSIPRSSKGMLNAGAIVSDPQPGDIVYYNMGGGGSHVGIYMGNGMMIDSSTWGTSTDWRSLYGSRTPTFLRF